MGSQNLNAECYLPVYERAQSDALTLIRLHPGRYLSTRSAGLVTTFGVANIDDRRPTWLDQAYRPLLGRRTVMVSNEGWNLPVLGTDHIPVTISYTLVFVYLLATVRMVAAAVRLVRLGWHQRRSWPSEELVWLAVGATVLMVIVGGVMLEFGENGRFRAMTDPLIVGADLGFGRVVGEAHDARQGGEIMSAAVIDARRGLGYCRHPWVGSGGAHATMADATIRRRPLLDGTRGVMMWVVLGYHLDGFTRLPGAWVSMDFFFVLSGYLITTLLLAEYTRSMGGSGGVEGKIDLRRFWTRRARRLLPALLVVLLGTFIIAGLMGGATEWPSLRGDGFSALFYYANWHFIWGSTSYWNSFVEPPLRHTWSLAIEEQFYLVWPLLFLVLMRFTKFSRLKMLAIMGGLLLLSAWWMRQKALGGVDLSRAYYGTDTRGQALIGGVMLAFFLWHDRYDGGKWVRRGSIIGTVSLVGLITMMFLFGDQDRASSTRTSASC